MQTQFVGGALGRGPRPGPGVLAGIAGPQAWVPRTLLCARRLLPEPPAPSPHGEMRRLSASHSRAVTCGPGWVVTLCPAMVFTRDLILALFRNHTMLCITVHFIFALFLLRTVSNSGYRALGPQNVTQPLHVAGPLRRAQCMDSVPRRPRAGQQSSSHSRTAPPCRPLAAQPAGRPQMPRFKSPGEWSLATFDASQEGNGFWRKLSEAERDVLC